jgi:imidazole glycerol-phosphate synthase subunit HisH
MTGKTITIVDYGLGNLGSVMNMVKHVGAKAIITSDPGEILRAEKLLLSGVGAFDKGMENIIALGFRSLLDEKVMQEKVPVLGICLGMQLLTKRSEEGSLDGFGWIDAETVRFDFSKDGSPLKVPHMGWNEIRTKKESRLLAGLDEDARFYFVHSYHLACRDEADILATTVYGYEFTSAVQKGNILGTQFHPEKSHRFGMQVLKNFCELE